MGQHGIVSTLSAGYMAESTISLRFSFSRGRPGERTPLLGVRRQSVSVVAGTLQKAGFIAYRHGLIRVVDREGLEAASCECYGVTETLYDCIMKDPPSG